MHIQFQNTSSDGTVATRQLTVTVGGERYDVQVSGDGSAEVPDEVGQYLLDTDGFAVTSHGDSLVEAETRDDADAELEVEDSVSVDEQAEAEAAVSDAELEDDTEDAETTRRTQAEAPAPSGEDDEADEDTR